VAFARTYPATPSNRNATLSQIHSWQAHRSCWVIARHGHSGQVPHRPNRLSSHAPSWADFITITPVFKLSVHTRGRGDSTGIYSASFLLFATIIAAMRQKLHLSPCSELRSLLHMHPTDQPRRLFFGLRFACVASCGYPVWSGLFRCLLFCSKSGVLPDLTPLSSRDLL
jgi:hypothetical protein